MQFFVMTPNGPMQLDQQQEHGHDNSRPVPPRVYVAMEFLRRCTGKTAPVVTQSGSMFGGPQETSVEDGQKLTDEESGAQATACNLLSQYFAGKLPRCEWDGSNAGEPDAGLTQLTITCVNCGGGTGMSRCKLCGGAGQVMVCRADAPVKKARKE
jgi:hypothetical protein